jgi:hypothetical protein
MLLDYVCTSRIRIPYCVEPVRTPFILHVDRFLRVPDILQSGFFGIRYKPPNSGCDIAQVKVRRNHDRQYSILPLFKTPKPQLPPKPLLDEMMSMPSRGDTRTGKLPEWSNVVEYGVESLSDLSERPNC